MLEWLQEQRKEWQSPRDVYLDAAIDVIAIDMRLSMSLIPPSAGVEFAMAMVGKSSEEVRLALLEHSFSSTQVNVPEPLRAELLAFPLDGERELDPHATVKYGLWTQDASDVAAVIKNQEPIRIVLGLVNVFTGDDADVVKIDVDSPDLHRLNALLSTMPHTDTYPDYKPHVTLGYVPSGTGQQFVGNSQFVGREFTADAIVFSSKDDHVTVIPLNERRVLPRAARRVTETSVHAAADSHVPSIKSLFTKAFAAGAAKVKVARTSSPTVVIKLMESAIHASADYLKTRLPDVLLACATDGGNAALGMLPTPRVLAAKKKIGQVDIEFDDENPDAVVWAKQHAAELITNISETTRERIKNEVVGAFKEGVSPKDLADALDAIVNDEDRAELIARTESMSASLEGQRLGWSQAVDKGLLTGDEKREWIATDGACDECSDLDGKVTDLDGEYPDPGEEGPPLHPMCLLPNSLVSAGGRISACSERVYEGDIVIISTTGGKQLSCTPNHPVLTRHGWIPAGCINKGDQVVCCINSESMFALNKHDINVPTRIHEVSNALRISDFVTSYKVKTSAKDFHGDGMDGQVAIINTNSLLRDNIQSHRRQSSSDSFFGFGLMNQCLLVGSRYFQSMFQCLLNSSYSHMRCLSESVNLVLGHFSKTSFVAFANGSTAFIGIGGQCFSLFDSCVAHSSKTGVNPIPDFNTRGCNFIPDTFRIFKPAPNRDTIEALIGEVCFDNVVSCERQHFFGQVYNLETEHGWYVAEGIITHNCRCTEGIIG